MYTTCHVAVKITHWKRFSKNKATRPSYDNI